MPGGKLLRVGVVALHGVELYDVAGEYLERLAEFSGESANLAIPIGDEQVLYVRQIPSRHTVRHDNWIGKSVPVEGTAIGEAAIGRVGADGYAFRNTTLEPDVTAIAAPVIGPDGRIVASFSVTVPSYRVDHGFAKRVGARLVREAWNMSEQLGAPSAMKPGVLAS
jgi:DNA-binding IclR family transcriptional regulator